MLEAVSIQRRGKNKFTFELGACLKRKEKYLWLCGIHSFRCFPNKTKNAPNTTKRREEKHTGGERETTSEGEVPGTTGTSPWHAADEKKKAGSVFQKTENSEGSSGAWKESKSNGANRPENRRKKSRTDRL
mmetsp:Transcript_116008/g.237197  ORF Transcript_116008/g.237197 Transcript_116008/m.237197 type:complete len:131 (-) Transcript_116008:43-435(-)